MNELIIDKKLTESEILQINKSNVEKIRFNNLDIDTICDMVEYLKENIIIDDFSLIKKELDKRKTYQGFKRSILNEVHRQLKLNLKNNDKAIDATIGNGHDTLFLAQILTKGHVYGFDIQDLALTKTNELIKDYKNVSLYKLSHELMSTVIKEKVKIILFNLGYLPTADKKITTKYQSTIKALKESLKLISSDGLILVVVYPGHLEGKKEKEHILKWLIKNNIKYEIKRNTLNEIAPFLIIIKK